MEQPPPHGGPNVRGGSVRGGPSHQAGVAPQPSWGQNLPPSAVMGATHLTTSPPSQFPPPHPHFPTGNPNLTPQWPYGPVPGTQQHNFSTFSHQMSASPPIRHQTGESAARQLLKRNLEQALAASAFVEEQEESQWPGPSSYTQQQPQAQHLKNKQHTATEQISNQSRVPTQVSPSPFSVYQPFQLSPQVVIPPSKTKNKNKNTTTCSCTHWRHFNVIPLRCCAPLMSIST